jgi:pimeloyl-ACP methyl ester carboxylesterase
MVDKYIETQIRCFPPDRALSILEIFTSYDMASEMQAVKAPIRGLNADLWPTNVEGNCRYAPGYDAAIMKDVGHYPMLERPEEFNRHLAQIVDELAQ